VRQRIGRQQSEHADLRPSCERVDADLAGSGTITASAALSRTISSLTRLTGSGTVTATTSVAHGFINGDTISISGASDPLYNGNFVIAGVTATDVSPTR
jgi:hypothetical protein